MNPSDHSADHADPSATRSDAPTVQAVANIPNELGEGPLWHPDQRLLYWTDIPAGKLFTFNPATGDQRCVYEDRPVGGMTIQADGALLLFRDQGNVVVWRDGEVLDTIIESLPGESESRFNDVIADPLGHVLCGTMPTENQKGRLYRLRTDGGIDPLLEDVDISNGFGFNEYLDTLYYVETRAQCVYAFDYDADHGGLSNQRRLIEVPEATGHPDGMTVDAQDHLWVAMWGTRRVVRYAPDGTPVQTIKFPARNTTAPTFAPAPGGDGRLLDGLYVTSASAWSDLKAADNDQAGALFCVTGVGFGRPEFRSRVWL